MFDLLYHVFSMSDILVPLPCFRRYAALYVSKHIFSLGEEVDDEIVGHVYLFLKEQLEISKMPPLSGVLHGTIIGTVSLMTYISAIPLFF